MGSGINLVKPKVASGIGGRGPHRHAHSEQVLLHDGGSDKEDKAAIA